MNPNDMPVRGWNILSFTGTWLLNTGQFVIKMNICGSIEVTAYKGLSVYAV